MLYKLLCFLFLQQPALFAPIIGQVVWILIAWTPAIVALVTIVRKLKMDARERLVIDIKQRQEGERVREIVLGHTEQIKELTSPQIVRDMTTLTEKVTRHDEEIRRLDRIHNECARHQNEIQAQIFKEIKGLGETIDKKFTELTSQIINIYKEKK